MKVEHHHYNNSDDGMSKPSKLDRLVTKFEENKTAIIAGTGFVAGVAATLWLSKPGYNSAQPIPNLLLTENEIVHEIACGILAAEFLKDRNLTPDILDFARKWIDENSVETLKTMKDEGAVLTRISELTAKM